MPHVEPLPAVSHLKCSPPVTATGTELLVCAPSPSSPWLSLPQQYAVPSAVRPQTCSEPAANCVNLTDVYTVSGCARCVPKTFPVELSPSWPALFPPQQYAVPSDVS